MTGYETRRPLGARLSLYDHQTDRVDLPGEALRLLGHPSGPVLDVGCGLGQYVDRLTAAGLPVVGLDASAAMARHVLGDACALPVLREVVVPTAEPIDAFVASLGAGAAVKARAAGRVRAIIDRDGVFRITSVVGIFACR